MDQKNNEKRIELKDEELNKVSGGERQNVITRFFINTDACVCCKCCGDVCPMNCIDFKGDLAVINQEHCIQCGSCTDACPVGAITRK